MRQLIQNVATQKPYESALLKELRSKERLLENQQPRVRAKRTGRILSPVREPKPTSIAPPILALSARARRVVDSIPTLNPPDIVQPGEIAFLKRSTATQPERPTQSLFAIG